MFSWLTKCWGGMGVNNNFERARIRSTISDWEVPDGQDIRVLLESFNGENTEIDSRMALQMFFYQMEADDQRDNSAFLLKHLYVLDKCVQNKIRLQEISKYYSKAFFNFQNSNGMQISPTREFIAAYFEHIRKKAQIYSQIPVQIFDSKRIKLLNSLEDTNTLFIYIDHCFQIQKGIKFMNDKHKDQDKSSKLIQQIFTISLKVYLFGYSVVSICLNNFICRIGSLSKPQLKKVARLTQYYNKDYTKQFYDLVEYNKSIAVYAEVKYSQFIIINKECLQYLNQLANTETPVREINIHGVSVDHPIEPLPEKYLQPEGLKVRFKARRIYDDSLLTPSGTQAFQQYENFYHEQYGNQMDIEMRREYEEKQGKDTKDLSSSGLVFSRKKVLTKPDSTGVFSKLIWNAWSNKYSK